MGVNVVMRGVVLSGCDGTVGVIFKNIGFCIFGIVGIVGAGRCIARCRYEAIFEYALVILEPYSSEVILFCSSFSERMASIPDAVWRR